MMRWLYVSGTLAMALPAAGAWAQQAPGASGRITGTVTAAETGQALVGTTVIVVGTRLGAVTRADGHYTITGVQPGPVTVRATMIGYAPVTTENVAVTAGGTATADFRLTRQATQLAAVVAVGYGTQSRRDVTGAVASVSAEQIQQVPSTNAIDAIKGRAPGVDITSSGYAPGSDVQVRIRGTRSLTASNDPLYVLDGIPMSGGISDINPNDIASLEVLKDASATAIYGSRGANGVILITTKQGSRQGRTQISYDGYAGAQQTLHKVQLMNGQEFAEYKREAYRTVGKYTTDADIFFPSELATLTAGGSTNWQNLVLRPGMQASHQLSVTGGSERTRFALSANQLGQDGITRGQDFTRRSFRLNFDHQPNGRLRMGASTLLTRSTQDLGRGNGLIDEALLNSPLGPVRDTAGALLFKPTPDGQRVNPLAEVANFLDERVRTRSFSTLFAEYTLAPGFSLRSNFGPDISFLRRGRFRGSETFDRQGGTPDAFVREDQVFAYTFDNFLRYQRNVGRADKLDATLLYSVQAQRTESDSTTVSGLPYESQKFYNLGSAGTIEGVGSFLERWALQSYMARVNYDLRGRYLLTLTGRVDGSSRLAQGQKYGLFPSVALAWRLSDEPFLRHRGWFDELKLRTSFGRTGNTGIAPYQTQGSLGRTAYEFGDAAAFGYRASVLPNPKLKWETTTQFDAGVDVAVLGNRISGTVDYYRARTNDLLLRRLLPPTTGFGDILENVGATRNTGLELSLTTVNVERPGRGGLRWSTTANWSTNRNRIVALSGGGNDVGSGRFIGQPINVYYDYKFAGIWQTADSALAATYSQRPGQIRVVDQNNDGRITDADRVVLGSPFAKWFGSLSNRVDWKGVDLSALVTTRQGFLVNSAFHTSYNTLFGRYNNLKVDYWTPTNPSNTNPRPNRDQEFPLYGGSRAYKDGSFVRVRNITLGYALPGSVTSRLRVGSARVYATAQDPFLFTSYTGFDPEAGSGTTNSVGQVTGPQVPSFRTLLAGLNLGF